MAVSTMTRKNNVDINGIKRGQVWWVDLGVTKGSEQGGERPVVVVQNDTGNKYSPTVTIVPLTSKGKAKLPTHVTMNVPYLDKVSIALIEQVRTIDKVRLIEFMGNANDYIMIEIDEALKIQNGLRKEFSYNKAKEMLDNIEDIKTTLREIGRKPSLVRVHLYEINSFKEYCSEYRMDHNIISQQYYKDKMYKNVI